MFSSSNFHLAHFCLVFALVRCCVSLLRYSAFGVDNSFSLDDFRENFRIEINEITANLLVFDLVGVDAPVANALRRILLAEVCSVFYWPRCVLPVMRLCVRVCLSVCVCAFFWCVVY